MIEQNTTDQAQTIQRGEPDTSPETRALVSMWEKRVQSAKKHFEKDFKRMREDMHMARTGEGEGWHEDRQYTVNLIAQHLNTKVSQVYAKNPTIIAKPKKRLYYQIWDGTFASFTAAQQSMAAPQIDPITGQAAPDPQAMALLQDIVQGSQRERSVKKIGETISILIDYYWNEQHPKFKPSVKSMVRRAYTTGVGYVKLDYQRIMQRRPEIQSKIEDLSSRIQTIEKLAADIQDNESDNLDADKEQLKNAVEALTKVAQVVIREGLVHDFPLATSIIPDPETKSLTTWEGGNWLAHEFKFTDSQIKKLFKKDVGHNRTRHDVEDGNRKAEYYKNLSTADPQSSKDGLINCWEIQCKETGTVFWLAEGYPDYLEPPEPPRCTLERFFNVFAYVVNPDEDENHLFPKSDVANLRHPQNEYNRARQSLREHRIAARPRHVTAKGAFEPKDLDHIKSNRAHDVLEINMGPGEKILDRLQAYPTNKIDPNLYETGSILNDIQIAGGAPEESLGLSTGDVTATKTSVAEALRVSKSHSTVDDLDELMTELAQSSKDILLEHMDLQQVQKIAGIGASWPDFSPEEIAEDLWVEIKAGSSGRPNKAMEIQNVERLTPVLVNIPGISPEWLARKLVETLDEDVNFEEAITSGLPSISAMNTSFRPPGEPGPGGPAAPNGDPRSDNPTSRSQGDQGVNNAEQSSTTPQTGGFADQAFPAPFGAI